MGYESSTYFYDPEMLGLLGLRTGGRDVEKNGPRAMEMMEELSYSGYHEKIPLSWARTVLDDV